MVWEYIKKDKIVFFFLTSNRLYSTYDLQTITQF